MGVPPLAAAVTATVTNATTSDDAPVLPVGMILAVLVLFLVLVLVLVLVLLHVAQMLLVSVV